MALKKSIPSAAGVPATYWRVCGMMIHEHERRAQIYLQGYPDEKTRRATNKDGTPRFQQLSFGALDLNADNGEWAKFFGEGRGSVQYPSKARLYEYVSAQPAYKGAVKC